MKSTHGTSEVFRVSGTRQLQASRPRLAIEGRTHRLTSERRFRIEGRRHSRLRGGEGHLSPDPKRGAEHVPRRRRGESARRSPTRSAAGSERPRPRRKAVNGPTSTSARSPAEQVGVPLARLRCGSSTGQFRLCSGCARGGRGASSTSSVGVIVKDWSATAVRCVVHVAVDAGREGSNGGDLERAKLEAALLGPLLGVRARRRRESLHESTAATAPFAPCDRAIRSRHQPWPPAYRPRLLAAAMLATFPRSFPGFCP